MTHPAGLFSNQWSYFGWRPRIWPGNNGTFKWGNQGEFNEGTLDVHGQRQGNQQWVVKPLLGQQWKAILPANLERQREEELSTLESAQWAQALQKEMQPGTPSREELVHSKYPDCTRLLPSHLLLVPPIGWAQPEWGGGWGSLWRKPCGQSASWVCSRWSRSGQWVKGLPSWLCDFQCHWSF